MGTIEKSVSWMEATARDDSHGYDQTFRWGEKGDMDCSSMEITSWEQAGVPVKEAGATYTGNMYEAFIKCGFIDVTDQVDLRTGKGMQRGDVLLNHAHHTASYCGNGYEVEASINEKGGARGGKPGDQTGREILIRPYRNYPWDCVLRYVETVPEKWVHDHVGWWYQFKDGSYPHDKWMEIDGDWFYFNHYGYAIENAWEQVDGYWYYFGSDCRMKTGWAFINGFWYYLDPKDGDMQTGWIKLDGIWYYLKDWGGMATGWLKLDDAWFYMNYQGEMQTGWQEINGYKYWFSKDGYMRKGWLLEDGKWFYFADLDKGYPDGALVKDHWILYKNAWYHLGSDGVMDADKQIEFDFDKNGAAEEVEA